MRAFGLLLRFFSYLFLLAVSLFFIGIGIVSVATSTPLHLDAIGLPPEKALLGTFVIGIVGLFATVLAFTGIFRLLYPLWAAVVVWILVKGFFLSAATFSGPASFRFAILITLGSIAALFGALSSLRRRPRL